MTTKASLCAAQVQTLQLLKQGIELLESISDELYASVDPQPGFKETPGPHLRHCVDACNCLLRGLQSGSVDYDARTRSADLESSRSVALSSLHELHAQMKSIEYDPGRKLRVRVDIPEEADDEPSAHSTLGREYQFLVSHTVHHYALIAMILRRSGFDPGPQFGVAPSTLRHWHEST